MSAALGHAPTMRETALNWRDALLSSPRFRSLAAALPPTRWIARRRARALFDLCAGFVYSQILLSCVRLRLFDLLEQHPQTAEELAPKLSLPVHAATRLLDAAVSLTLLTKRRGHRYGLGPLGCAMIGNAGIAEMVEHHTTLYDDLRDPLPLLRGEVTGGLACAWAYADPKAPPALRSSDTDGYTRLMAASQAFVAEEVLAAYDFRRHICLLDIGGGDGSFLTAVAAQAPTLELKLLDLPSVAAVAQARLAAGAHAHRSQAIAGDAIAGPLPPGADIISFVRVLHDHDDSAVLAMLRLARASLPPGGTVLIAEPMSGTPGAEPIGDAYFGLYFLAMGQGRSRTPDALAALLTKAGFGAIRLHPTRLPIFARVITATSPPQP